MKNWEKEFNEIYRRATGEENIVGDLLVKQFIQNLLDKQKEEIKEKIRKVEMGERWAMQAFHNGYDQAKIDILKKLNK